jgi:hypothetical protein
MGVLSEKNARLFKGDDPIVAGGSHDIDLDNALEAGQAHDVA